MLLTVVQRVAFALALAAVVVPLRAPQTITSIDGRTLTPFAPSGKASVIFFVATDCPVSNSYAPEIQRVCRDYAAKGVSCSLMYEDIATPGTSLEPQVRAHLTEYRYSGIPAAIDSVRSIAVRAQARVTPEVVVVDPSGQTRYRGRIDNFYAALGVSRQTVTEHNLRAALDDVLAGRQVSTPVTEAVGCYIVDPAVMRK